MVKKLIFTAVVLTAAVACIFVLLHIISKSENGRIVIEPPVPGIGNTFKMRLVKLEPPVIFYRDTIYRGQPPDWAYSTLWALNLTETTVSRYFSEAYIKENGAPKLNRPAPELYSAVYFLIELEIENHRFRITGSAYSNKVESIPPNAVGIGVLEWLDDSWKTTAPPKWISVLPWTNLDEISEIISTRRATLNPMNRLESVP